MLNYRMIREHMVYVVPKHFLKFLRGGHSQWKAVWDIQLSCSFHSKPL